MTVLARQAALPDFVGTPSSVSRRAISSEATPSSAQAKMRSSQGYSSGWCSSSPDRTLRPPMKAGMPLGSSTPSTTRGFIRTP